MVSSGVAVEAPRGLFCRSCSKTTTPGGQFCAFCGRSLRLERPVEAPEEIADKLTGDLDALGIDTAVESIEDVESSELFDKDTHALIVGQLPLGGDTSSRVKTIRATAPTRGGKESLRDVLLYAPSDTARQLAPDAVPRRTRSSAQEVLTPYERLILAQIDGESSLGALRERSKLTAGELLASILTLMDRGLITVATASGQELSLSTRWPVAPPPNPDETWIDLPKLDDFDLEPTERRSPARAYYDAALRDQAAGAIVSARVNMKLAVSLEPSNAQFREELERLRAEEQRSMAEKATTSAGAKLFEEAVSVEAAGETVLAIRLLERCVDEHNYSAAMNRLAVILATHQRDYERARGLLERAIELEPENASYSHNLFKVLEALDRRSGAGDPGKKSLAERVTSLWDWIRGRGARGA